MLLLFGFQIFSDFAGYSCIAIGLGYLLGFKLPTNFNSPYIACIFSDFWEKMAYYFVFLVEGIFIFYSRWKQKWEDQNLQKPTNRHDLGWCMAWR